MKISLESAERILHQRPEEVEEQVGWHHGLPTSTQSP
jgi:hypothetical protein